MHPLIEYIPLQQGLRLQKTHTTGTLKTLIEYIPLQQGLRRHRIMISRQLRLIEYIPLQQGLRLPRYSLSYLFRVSLSIFHYNKD